MTPPRSTSRLFALCAALLSLGAAACGETDEGDDAGAHDAGAPETRWEGKTAGGHYHVTLTPEPAPPPFAKLFRITTRVQAADLSAPATVTKASLTGWMPEHDHGMEGFTPKTSVSPGVVGEAVTEGLFFTMPGQWELTFRVEAGAHGPDEVVLPVFVGQ